MFKTTETVTQIQSDRLIRAAEFCKLIGVGQRQLYALIAAGKVPKPVKLGNTLRWRESSVNEFIKSL